VVNRYHPDGHFATKNVRLNTKHSRWYAPPAEMNFNEKSVYYLEKRMVKGWVCKLYFAIRIVCTIDLKAYSCITAKVR
jgi:hypothetical protein